jgi:carboxypeptidase family protein
MRCACLTILFAWCCFGQPQLSNEKASISGSVISAAGEPLRRVTLRLAGPPTPTFYSTEAPVVSNLATETDLQGNFHFDNVEPGRYMLNAARSGYLPGVYTTSRGPIFTLSPSQTMAAVVIKMTPQGIIAGKVVDEDREPLPGVSVTVRISSLRGRRIPPGFEPPGVSGTTDADGAFAIGGLNPGQYFVSVAAPPNPSRDTPAPGIQKEEYVTTYYPDVTDAAETTPIEVGAGAQVRGLEVRLQKVPIFNIRGKVVIAATGEAGSPDVVNLIRRGSRTPGLSARVTSVRDGEFSFEGVLPGDYNLETKPTGETKGSRPLVGCQVISVGHADLDRVVVEMKPAIELSGRVLVEGAPASTWPQVTLTPTDGLNYPDLPMIGADGRFTLTGLEPSHYQVVVNPIPPPMYLKSVRFNGLNLTGDIDLASAPAGSLEVVIGYGTSSINGVVSDVNGPVGPGINVLVGTRELPLARMLRTDNNGRFSGTDLPAGEYFLVAMDGPGLFLLDGIEKIGKAVTLGESDTVVADLRLTTSDDLPGN